MLTFYRQLNIFEFESGESEDEEEWLGMSFNRLIRNLHGWMEPLPLTVEEPQRLYKVKCSTANYLHILMQQIL